MDSIPLPDAVIPTDWYIVFHTRGVRRWVSWLALGCFKHVSAFAYCPGLKVWVLYDVHLGGTQIALLADHSAPITLARWTEGCEVVRIKRRSDLRFNPLARLGFFCVPAMRHLLGVPGCALRPSSLYRQLIADGGELIGRQHNNSGAGITCGPEPAV